MAAKLTGQLNGAGAGWAVGGVAASLLIGILIEPFRRTVGLENVTIVYLATVVLTAAFGGHAAGLLTAVAAALSYDFFLPPPTIRWSSTRPHRSSPSDCYWPPVLPPAWPDAPGGTLPSPSTSRPG